MNVGNVNQGMALKLLDTMYQPASKQIQQSTINNIQQDLTETLKKSGQTIAISTLGKQINELYSELGKEGDDTTIQAARESLRKTITEFAKSPDNKQLLDFMQATKEYARAYGTSGLQEAFETALAANREGVNITEWWNTFSSIGENSLRNSFVNETENILATEESSNSKRTTINNMMETIRNIQTYMPEEEQNNAMADLFNQLKEAQNLEQKNQVMANFREENFSDKGLI